MSSIEYLFIYIKHFSFFHRQIFFSPVRLKVKWGKSWGGRLPNFSYFKEITVTPYKLKKWSPWNSAQICYHCLFIYSFIFVYFLYVIGQHFKILAFLWRHTHAFSIHIYLPLVQDKKVQQIYNYYFRFCSFSLSIINT